MGAKGIQSTIAALRQVPTQQITVNFLQLKNAYLSEVWKRVKQNACLLKHTPYKKVLKNRPESN